MGFAGSVYWYTKKALDYYDDKDDDDRWCVGSNQVTDMIVCTNWAIIMFSFVYSL